MEKYVVEALFMMDQPEFGLERLKSRFGDMVNHPWITTLWEGWGIGSSGYGGGSINHAWSGGGLTILAQYVAGLYPSETAWKKFNVKPQMGSIKKVSVRVPSLQGDISLELEKTANTFTINISVPDGSTAMVYIPFEYTFIEANSHELFARGAYISHPDIKFTKRTDRELVFEVPPGSYKLVSNK